MKGNFELFSPLKIFDYNPTSFSQTVKEIICVRDKKSAEIKIRWS